MHCTLEERNPSMATWKCCPNIGRPSFHQYNCHRGRQKRSFLPPSNGTSTARRRHHSLAMYAIKTVSGRPHYPSAKFYHNHIGKCTMSYTRTKLTWHELKSFSLSVVANAKTVILSQKRKRPKSFSSDQSSSSCHASTVSSFKIATFSKIVSSVGRWGTPCPALGCCLLDHTCTAQLASSTLTKYNTHHLCHSNISSWKPAEVSMHHNWFQHAQLWPLLTVASLNTYYDNPGATARQTCLEAN